jgi:hypothetical protein
MLEPWYYHKEWIYIHYPNLVILKASAESGCPMCRLLFHVLKDNKTYDMFVSRAEELEQRCKSTPPKSVFDWEMGSDEVESIAQAAAHQVIYEDEYLRKKNGKRPRLSGQLAELRHQGKVAGRIVLFSKHGDSLKMNYYSHGVRIKVLTSNEEEVASMSGVLGTLITTGQSNF